MGAGAPTAVGRHSRPVTDRRIN
uniref:Uncharacterized protein n=1 Tax=Leersia perrieri TaxID=77586 RepID=A0A0D9WPZ8_9ORYZ